jgi:hypothetical protein
VASQIFASLHVTRSAVRAITPHGNMGMLEVLVGRGIPATGVQLGRLPEVAIYDYSGVDRAVLRQDVWLVEDKANPGPYEIEQFQDEARPDQAWAVISTPLRAVAACPMEGASKYLGTREQAQQWADALNERFSA